MRQIRLLFSLNCYPVWEDWLQTRKQLNTDTIPKCENATKRCRACQSSRQRKLESVTQKEACVVCWVSNQKARALPWMTSLSRWWLERVRACSKPESLTQDIWGGTPEFASLTGSQEALLLFLHGAHSEHLLSSSRPYSSWGPQRR